MKQLKNDYTTPEQSKKLLELGVPEWTATDYYGKDGKIYRINGSFPIDFLVANGLTLAWSVGRLMYIQEKCTGAKFFRTLHPDLLGDIMGQIEYTVGTIGMDFSKLED